MNKIEKIRAEIERLIEINKTKNGFPAGINCAIRIEAYEALLAFLDSLEEEPDKSLEEEIRRYLREECSSDDEPTAEETARHFAEWQKAQMLKDAVEGEAEELYNDGESQCTVGVGTYFKPGERVYVLNAMEGKE